MNDPSAQGLLASRGRWEDVTATLARHFSAAHEALRRIFDEAPESSHLAHESFAVRNLQILSVEALDFLRAHWAASTAQEMGETVPLPEFRIGRWRELLDVSHPARPFNPHLAIRPELKEQIRLTKSHLESHQMELGQNPLQDDRPLVLHYATLTRQADIECAQRVSPHETLGILRALTDLTQTASLSPNASPTLRVLAAALGEQFKNVQGAYVKSLQTHLNMPRDADPSAFAAIIARRYQHIGLLRADMRAEFVAFNLSPEDEKRFLDKVSNDWTSYHLGIKPFVWFQTLLRLSKSEIDGIQKTIHEAKTALLENPPLYAALPVRIAIEAAVEPLIRNLSTAQRHAGFLKRHREDFISAGKYTAHAAAAYAFGIAPAGLLALGETAIYTRYAGAVTEKLSELAANAGSNVLVKDALTAVTRSRESAKKVFIDRLLGSRLERAAELWREFLFRSIPRRSQAPTRKMVTEHHESLRTLLTRSASTLSLATWDNFKRRNPGFVSAHRVAISEYLDFAGATTDVMRQMRRANRAFREIDELNQRASGATSSFASREMAIIASAEQRLRELVALASRENSFQQESGFAAGRLARPQRFWTERNGILASLGQVAFDAATSRRSSTLGDRPLALVHVRYDPSPLDRQLWDMLNLEDKAANNTPSFARFSSVSVGTRYHLGLPPTEHVRSSLLKVFFPNAGVRALFSNVASVLRESSVRDSVLRDLHTNPPSVAPIRKPVLADAPNASIPI